ncbi:MAG: PBP1A family penicillin-binding protein [Candidatus Kerfeldbacteria bacterium]|nr:PBP1A family penicillin-binding protein [Candidatus Kerfeldbacteria bacterium]
MSLPSSIKTTRRHSGSGAILPARRFPGRSMRRHGRWRRRLLAVVAIGLFLSIVGGVAVVAWVSQDLPDPNNLNTRVVAQSTKIYARDGKTILYDIHGDQRRTSVNLEDISPHVIQATLAVEDKDFYKHAGVSLRAIIRAVWVDVTHGSKAQGGSTITQQLVKNSILTREKTFTRKIKELVLAYQIDRRFSKDQVLRLYFNEIPYGASAYGVEAAAETYFGKRAKDLDLAESSLLAAMVQAPTFYSPNGSHRTELIQRQHFVLSLMVEQKRITKTQADEARTVDVLARISPYRDRIVAPHFVFYVRDYLEQKYGDVLVEKGGLRVVTTLDPDLQKIAEDEVAKGAVKNEKSSRADNAALVAIDPKTGQVLAMVGSRDFFDTAHDGNFNVATAVRNPGSSFKPIVYLTAFTKGYTPETTLFDLKTDFGPDGSGKDFIPNNFDGKEHGPVSMRQGLAGSLNIPAVKTLYLAGLPNVLDVADRFGYTTIDRSKVGLALAIGGGGVTLLEHTGAFSVLANDGVRDPVTSILRIEDKAGKVLEQYQKKETRVADQDAVRRIVDVLSDNNARAFVFGSHSPLILSNRPVAAKTGTTNDFKDGWTLGFTPSLAAGVWVGRNDNGPLKAGSDGVVVAGPIWHAFMERALKGKPVESFQKPPPNTSTKPVLQGKLQSQVPISVDTVTGNQIPDSCLAPWPPAYVGKKYIRKVHDVLYYVNKDDPGGPPPADPTVDPMFSRWESSVQAWAKKNNYVAQSPALENCSLRTSSTGPTIAFSQPTNNQTVTTSSVVAAVSASEPGASITSVQFSFDGSVVATLSAPPFSSTLDVSSLSNGFHSLSASATDNKGISSSASLNLNILHNAAQGSQYFISPSPRSKISHDSFPQEVQVFAYDPVGVASITLSMKAADGTITTLDAVNSPSDSTVSLSWPTTAPGDYQLFFQVKNNKAVVTQSDFLPVTVN